MSRFGTQYRVARPTGVCAATGQALEPGSTCVAALCELGDSEGFERSDYTIEAWEGRARPEGLFSFWRTVVPDANARKSVLVDDAVLMDLFERLADDERPQRVAFRFILALILLRKRHLKFAGRSGAADEPKHWRLTPKGADPDAPPIEVVDPGLSDEDVRDLTAQLSEVLQGQL